MNKKHVKTHPKDVDIKTGNPLNTTENPVKNQVFTTFSGLDTIGTASLSCFKNEQTPGLVPASSFVHVKDCLHFLDNISTTGSHLNISDLEGLPSTGLTAVSGQKSGSLPPTDYNRAHGRRWERLQTNKKQVKYLYNIAKENPEERLTALNVASALRTCGTVNISEKLPDGNFRHIARYRCGKKVCAECSNWKRNKLIRLFTNYFESVDEGINLLKEYDLALFTVTLRHNKETRNNVYYDELRVHFRNAIKYGAFAEYIHGGFYNTEHKYNSETLHHIHRHALVLIPKQFDVKKNWQRIQGELQKQWLSRTGDSFQVDLTPLGFDKQKNEFRNNTLFENLLEVTKYVTDRDDEDGLINYEIVKAVEQNRYYKFYNRFGNLYKSKFLKMNQKKIEDAENTVEVREAELSKKDLYFTSGLYAKVKTVKEKSGKYSKTYESYQYKKIDRLTFTPKIFEEFQLMNIKNRNLWKYKTYFNFEDGYTYDAWRSNKEAKERLRLQQLNRTITQLPINYTFLVD